MSLIEHYKAGKSNGKAKKGPSPRSRAFSALADALGIDDDKRADAESAIRLYLEVSRTEDED